MGVRVERRPDVLEMLAPGREEGVLQTRVHRGRDGRWRCGPALRHLVQGPSNRQEDHEKTRDDRSWTFLLKTQAKNCEPGPNSKPRLPVINRKEIFASMFQKLTLSASCTLFYLLFLASSRNTLEFQVDLEVRQTWPFPFLLTVLNSCLPGMLGT